MLKHLKHLLLLMNKIFFPTSNCFWVASACNGLKQGLGSQPEVKAGSQQCKHLT